MANQNNKNANKNNGNKGGKSFRGQLKEVAEKIRTLPKLANHWKGDGEDHINIGNLAQTDLGRMLNPAKRMQFTHPVLGSFATLSNLWHFARARVPVDEIRTIPPRRTADMTRAGDGTVTDPAGNFDYIVAEGAWILVQRNVKMRDMLKESTLPFDIYQVNEAGLRSRIVRLLPVVRIYEEIRLALKEDRDPNFKWLIHSKGDPLASIRQRLGLPSREELEARKEPVKRERPAIVNIDDMKTVKNEKASEKPLPKTADVIELKADPVPADEAGEESDTSVCEVVTIETFGSDTYPVTEVVGEIVASGHEIHPDSVKIEEDVGQGDSITEPSGDIGGEIRKYLGEFAEVPNANDIATSTEDFSTDAQDRPAEDGTVEVQ